jgi:cytochrome c peroxidase
MDIGNRHLFVVAVIALLVGAAVLLAMVRYDLGPGSRLTKGRRWLLAIALGTGILAFAVKLTIIALVSGLPEVVIDPMLERQAVQRPVSVPDPLFGMLGAGRLRWQPLSGTGSNTATAQLANSTPYIWQTLPEQAPAPVDNPTTREKVALGRRLFFDTGLSRDGTLSCASCHDVEGGSGADAGPTSIGIDRQRGSRNAPTVWNAAFQSVLFWDGRAASLEAQAKGPLVNPLEMGMPNLAEVERRVRQDPLYREPFERAFGEAQAVTIERIVQAIAAYERTLITSDSPYDRFVRGDLDAMTPSQLRGMAQFQTLGCVQCHFGPNFSGDASLFDERAPWRIFPIYATPYEAQYGLTLDSGAAPAGSGRGSWRVPSLRNVALTGPWLHNGSVSELAEAVRIMSSVQLGYTGRYLVWSDSSKAFAELERPQLDEATVQDIVAFLQALSSDELVDRMQRKAAAREHTGFQDYASLAPE